MKYVRISVLALNVAVVADLVATDMRYSKVVWGVIAEGGQNIHKIMSGWTAF